MKQISTYLRAFFSLGWLGLVILLMALAVSLGAFSQSSDPFNAAVERMSVLGELESEVALDLAEKQVQESLEFFSLSYGLPSLGAVEKAGLAEARISETLAGLEQAESFVGSEEFYRSNRTLQLQEFNQFRTTHREDFEYATSFANELSDEDFFDAIYTLEEGNEMLAFQLRDIVTTVEQDRQLALADFADDITNSILIIVFALVVTFILALFGYQAIASAVRPLIHLQNTITTIGGDVYRPGKTSAAGASSQLAKALDSLAQAEQARNQAAKQEIEKLRQELYESRRRRLRVYQPGKKTE